MPLALRPFEDLSESRQDTARERLPSGGFDNNLGPHKRFRLLQEAGALVTDSELLEMTLFRIVPEKRIYSVVEALLSKFGTFAGIVAAPQRELRKVRGLGDAGAIKLRMVPLAAERLVHFQDIKRLRLENPNELHNYLMPKLNPEAGDVFFIVYLNSRNHLIADGMEAGFLPLANPLDKRRFLRTLLSHYATAVILVHYRPGRDANPSPYDYDTIKMIKSSVGPLSVVLQDYIVIGKTRWISFQRESLL